MNTYIFIMLIIFIYLLYFIYLIFYEFVRKIPLRYVNTISRTLIKEDRLYKLFNHIQDNIYLLK